MFKSKKIYLYTISATLILGLVFSGYFLSSHKNSSSIPPEKLAFLNKKREKKIKSPKRYDKPKEAQEFYFQQRVAPGGTAIPVEKYTAAWNKMVYMPRYSSSQQSFLPSISNTGKTTLPLTPGNNFSGWSSLGPGNIGGRTRALVIDKNTPATMYAAGVSGGIWKSTDSGASWSVLDDMMANLAVTSLVIDPNNSNILYAGTGEGFFNFDAVRGDGIFKSTDAGATWTQLSATASNTNFYYVNKMVISPNDSQRLYAATRTGIWQSSDGGTNWTQTYSTSVRGGCLDLATRTDQNPDFVLASCGSFVQASIIRSTNSGTSWSTVFTETNMGRTTLAIAPSLQTTIYALASSIASGNFRNGLYKVLRSTDGGVNWTTQVDNTSATKLNTALLSNTIYRHGSHCGLGTDQYFNQGWYDNIIAVDPVIIRHKK